MIIKGQLTIRNALTGEVLHQAENMVVDDGLELIADRMKDNTQAALGWIAVGTSNVTVAATDSALYAEIDRNAATVVNANLNTLEIETDFSAAEAVATWREVGVFNAAAAGVMFNRINIDFTKTAATPINVKFIFTWTRA